MLFRDRSEAGRALARKLERYAGRGDVVVLALPRGGVPVAYEIARELGAPLDAFVVRKLGMPGRTEVAIGAIATGGVRVLNSDVIQAFGITKADVDRVTAQETRELEQREKAYRESRAPEPVEGRTAILVDDGLASGATMRAAVAALRRRGPKSIVVAVPVGSPDTCGGFKEEVDDVVCAETPEPLIAVGFWYDDFSQTSDEEVHELLRRSRQGAADRAK